MNMRLIEKQPTHRHGNADVGRRTNKPSAFSLESFERVDAVSMEEIKAGFHQDAAACRHRRSPRLTPDDP